MGYGGSNSQQLGFDALMKCDGMLVLHIDETIAAESNQITSPFIWNRVNTILPSLCVPNTACGTHRGVVVVEADGDDAMQQSINLGSCRDVYREGNNISWSGSRSNLWSGLPTGLNVTVLQQCSDRGLLLSITSNIETPIGVTIPIPDTCDTIIAVDGAWTTWSPCSYVVDLTIAIPIAIIPPCIMHSSLDAFIVFR
jgi:hypothetical protein